MKQPLRAIIFDLDGTLIEPELQFFYAETERLFKNFGIAQVGRDEIRHAHSRGVLFEYFPHTNREAMIDSFWRDYRSEHYPHPRLLAGCKEALVAISAMGIKLAITTAREDTPEIIRGYLSNLEIAQYFQAIFSGGVEAPTMRDKVSLIQQALAVLQVKPNETAIVGDALIDTFSGKKAGLALTIAVQTGGQEYDYLNSFGADFMLSSITELPSLLRTFG